MASTEIVPPVGDRITLTIASGESVSNIARIAGKQLVGLITPASWTAADLGFLVMNAAENISNPVYDNATERLIAAATMGGASRFLALDSIDYLGMPLLRLRSGTAALAVNQGAARTLQLVVADGSPR